MPSGFKSLKGQLLLDGGKLTGSFFHRSVVLICQHDPEGAFGLILNRSTGKSLGELVVADLPSALRERDVFLGGPVQPEAFSYLHSDQCLLNATVLPQLELGHSLDDLVETLDPGSSTQRLRVFAGYAGWSPGQLDSEMKRDSWLTHPASVDLVFSAAPGDLWATILRTKGWEGRLLAQTPDDPAVN